MTDSRRNRAYVASFLERVGRSWREEPDSRFGQFVSNVAGCRPLETTTDAGFLETLNQRGEEIARSRREAELHPLPPSKYADEVRRTNEAYRRWALRTFGRVGRDPARIEPFLARLGEAWLGRSHLSFCELVASTGGAGLRLLEEEAFLRLLDEPGSISEEEIEEAYVYRGPLGDLLRELENHDEGPP